jgi:hypothetical protein
MDAPYRWRVADNQTQRTLGGNIMELHETGPYVLWHDYARLQYKSQCQTEGIDAFDKKLREAEAEVERLTDCKAEADRFKAEVERLTKENETINKDRALLWASHKIALQDIRGLHYAIQTAKDGNKS